MITFIEIFCIYSNLFDFISWSNNEMASLSDKANSTWVEHIQRKSIQWGINYNYFYCNRNFGK